MHTYTEENYLKSIYHLLEQNEQASTNDIAASLKTRAASVTDMLKKLAEKKLINYARYQGVSLTPAGQKVALGIIRKHRLWEHFLVDKLKFKWDEVHDMAEELEHISSVELINRLEQFMDYPQFDPHGDPIPNSNGEIKAQLLQPALALTQHQTGVIAAVSDHSASFLQYLEKIQLTIGKEIKVTEITDYDLCLEVTTDNKVLNISREVAKNLLIAL
ncbi:metal-dependent transcriptional regulator [Mucilaginibacter sp. Bleaf8]|uniref:metal-dependent transcriptional regulator n=1 Tax=Mucilaginibacter sp. Bleaf8 TaxID=2834430 RepID=UPI001BD018C6|nr:metal-dependent transcriptional regulator [Mucilaginibacter sp. Bleaf8]MBS7565202.1 metal-dependent transcriptional regulator [Mucilaginibacter sp. Bleaf8]